MMRQSIYLTSIPYDFSINFYIYTLRVLKKKNSLYAAHSVNVTYTFFN